MFGAKRWPVIDAGQTAQDAFDKYVASQSPCPKCEGREVTWQNIRQGRFCDKHQGEIMRAITASQSN